MQFTPEFWMILGLTLVLGWVLGLMSRSGGKKWKTELHRERKEHEAAIRNRDTQIEALKARNMEYERSRPAVAPHPADDVRHRDSALDNLDLTRRGGDTAHRDDFDGGRTVIRPTRP